MSSELEKVIQEGNDMKLLLEDDKFKKFYDSLTDDLAKSLVKNYSGRDTETRSRIEEQMTMVSGLMNYVNGTVQAGEMAEAQLEQYNAEEEVA